MYYIFTYEPLHNLYIGISKLLKELLSIRLSDHSLQTSFMKNKNGDPKSFDTIRSDLLNGINRILSCIQAENPGSGLKIDFSTAGKGHRFNGLFKQHGLIGMLEGSDHRSIDQFMPFIAMFLDINCNEGSLTTKVFVKYAEILMLLTRTRSKPTWNAAELEGLRTAIAQFKTEAKALYGKYQASKMCTPKFHLLDHVCSDIERMGGLQYGDASQFEHSHVNIKAAYKGTSKRKRSVMDETVRTLSRTISKKKQKTSGTKKGARFETYDDGIVSLVRDGNKFTFADLKQTYLQERSIDKNGIGLGVETNAHVSTLIKDIGLGGTRVLIELLKNKYEKKQAHTIMHLKLQRVSSAFVSGGFVPSAKHVLDLRSDTLIRYEEPEISFSQRVVSAGNYYGSGNLKQDCVLVEASVSEIVHPRALRSVWVAKVLGIFRIKSAIDNLTTEEVAFVQYFDTIKPTSEAMTELRCVNLRWAREEYDNSSRGEKCTRWFDIVPASSIRGVVQVVSIDYPIRNISSEKPWYEKTYHINRFFHNPKDILY